MTHASSELTAYVDGALAAPERERVDEHLATCAECRTERDRLTATVALLRRLAPAPVVSPRFEQRFYARLAAEKQARRPGVLERLGLRGWWWRWFGPGLAGAVATALVMIYVGGRERADEAFLAANLDLFESYEEVASVGAIDRPDDVAVVAHLHELRGAP